MINRIATKSDKINLTKSSLCIGNENFLEIPLTSINCIKFYPPTDIEAGYLAIVKNEFEDADIIFFHKNFEERFKTICDEINIRINSNLLTNQKAAS